MNETLFELLRSGAVLTFTLLVFLMAATWLFPMIAAALHLLSPQVTSSGHQQADGPMQIRVLLPAHNEQTDLKISLLSIQSAVAAARSAWPEIQFEIRVGCDACSDQTEEIARESGAKVLVLQNRSKWKTLQTLVCHDSSSGSEMDWCVLVDAGTTWPEDFLTRLIAIIRRDSTLLGVAPAYRPGKALISRLLWRIEATIKALENRSQGPISVHGATVAYRTRPLIDVFEATRDQSWLNDDVVLPLTLRVRNPCGRILYLSDLKVSDESRKPAGNPIHRRRRLVMGNIQWIHSFFLILLKTDFKIALLALRRIVRLFWGYGFILAFTLLHYFPYRHNVRLATIQSILSVLVFLAIRKTDFCQALRSSLESPFLLAAFKKETEVAWK